VRRVCLFTHIHSYTYLFTREHEGGGRFINCVLEVPYLHLSPQVPSQHFIVFQEAHTAQGATVSIFCGQCHATCQKKKKKEEEEEEEKEKEKEEEKEKEKEKGETEKEKEKEKEKENDDDDNNNNSELTNSSNRPFLSCCKQ
jgi:hypothetical protein